VKGLGRRE